MAANLGQPFMGAGGMLPSLAQELASSNFHENRESFHDYIYSKLILGEDKGNNQNTGVHGGNNPPVFPNTNLSNSYPNPVGPPSNAFTQSSNNSAFVNSLPVSAPSQPKPSSSKKKSNIMHPPLNLMPQAGPSPVVDGTPKPKKKSHHKKKDKTNVCDVCGRGFAEKYTLNRHMLTHTNIKPYSCTKCNMSFSRSDGLAKHMAAGHRRIDAHHCDVCGGTFNSEVSYEQHRREYGSTLPFVCNLCMLAFSQCCHLNYHMKSHSLNKLNDSVGSEGDDKNNAIDVSELVPDDFVQPKQPSTSQKDTLNLAGLFANFGKSGDLLRRTGAGGLGMMDPNITIKPEVDEMPSCSTAMNNSGVQNNSAGVTGRFDTLTSLPSSSASGSANFNKGNNLGSSNLNVGSTPTSGSNYMNENAHLNSSSSGNSAPPISEMEMKKYFDIKIPNPKFIEQGGNSGEGNGEETLYRCGLCGKGFTRKYHMQRHVKLHTRGPIPRAHLLDWTRRPYACGVCKMGFTRQHHLTRHMLIHTGERPHACHVCGKAFRRFTNLSLHVRTVHGAERPFKCPVCGRGFPRLYSLQRHIKLHTKEVEARLQGANGEGYTDFKAVGTVDRPESNKSSGTGGASKLSPGNSRDSVSSDNSAHSNKFEGRKPSQSDNATTVDLTREENGSKEMSHGEGQNGSRMQNVIPSQTIEVVNQHNRILGQSGENINRQNRNVNEFNPRALAQPGSSDRFNPPNAPIQNQSLRNMDLSSNRGNFTEMDYSLNQQQHQQQQQQQQGNGERFSLHQPRIQSPHTGMINPLERPGSRGMLSQPNTHDNPNFNPHNPNSFVQQTQQLGSMDLSAGRSTMSPASVRGEPTAYNHNQRVELQSGNNSRGGMGMDLQGNARGSSAISAERAALERALNLDLQAGSRGITDPPAYSHPLQYAGAHGVYQQAMADSLNRIELHPGQSVSPMNTHPHNNNLQY